MRTGVRVRDMDGGRKQQMSDRAKYKRAAQHDIAYNIMRMWQGAVGVAPLGRGVPIGDVTQVQYKGDVS